MAPTMLQQLSGGTGIVTDDKQVRPEAIQCMATCAKFANSTLLKLNYYSLNNYIHVTIQMMVPEGENDPRPISI